MSDNKCPNCGAPFERVIRSPFQEGKGVHYLCGTAQWPNGLANENNLICRYINALRTKLEAAQQRVKELEGITKTLVTVYEVAKMKIYGLSQTWDELLQFNCNVHWGYHTKNIEQIGN